MFRERGSDFPPPVSLSSTILSFFLSRPVTVTRDTLRLSRLSLLLFPGGNQILVTLRFPLLREREEFHFFIIFLFPSPSGVWPAMTSRFSLLSPKNMSFFKSRRRRQRFPESQKKKETKKNRRYRFPPFSCHKPIGRWPVTQKKKEMISHSKNSVSVKASSNNGERDDRKTTKFPTHIVQYVYDMWNLS